MAQVLHGLDHLRVFLHFLFHQLYHLVTSLDVFLGRLHHQRVVQTLLQVYHCLFVYLVFFLLLIALKLRLQRERIAPLSDIRNLTWNKVVILDSLFVRVPPKFELTDQLRPLLDILLGLDDFRLNSSFKLTLCQVVLFRSSLVCELEEGLSLLDSECFKDQICL